MFSSIFKNFSIQRVGISHETAFNEDSGKAFRAPPLGGGAMAGCTAVNSLRENNLDNLSLKPRLTVS